MKPELGVCYYPEHWPEQQWLEDAEQMREIGLSWVRVGEFAWSRLEPSEGQFEWTWLDKAVDILGKAGLKVIMGTPSATPPHWVLRKFPDMLAVDMHHQPRKFGSRRHYCFSHEGYRTEAARMARDMAKRYGQNPYIQAWQIDNEYGCHDTTISYSEAAKIGFQNWLGQKYQSTDALNKAWGNIFWSMEYTDFSDVDLPNLTVTEANPSHCLDFRRYISDQVVAFNADQVAAIRPYSSKPLIHNYMGRITDFDHFRLGDDLDIASWDSYPMGFLEQVLAEESDEWKAHFAEQGDPDFQAFHHDLYRAVGQGRWWVMEQQPGPVNWAKFNPVPLNGMVKIWTMEAIAHGAEVISYFRWRQAPFAQEQMHAGLLRPDSIPAQAFHEVIELKEELEKLGEIQHQDAEVAIVFDYPSQWATDIQPQGASFDYFRLVFEQYRALRSLGLSVDIISASCDDFGSRKLVFIPSLMAWTTEIQQAIERFDGVVVAGPRTGLKTHDHQIALPIGPNFADALTLRVATMRPNIQKPLNKGGAVIHWLEEIECNNPIEETDDGQAVLTQKGQHFYLAGWLDSQASVRIFGDIAAYANVITLIMPEGVRQRKFGNKSLILNYNNEKTRLGDITIPATGYCIVDTI